jgi:hypothetical protein
MIRTQVIKSVASMLASAGIGALCGLMALGLTSLPLFDSRPSPFGPNSVTPDGRVEFLYWMICGTFHCLSTALVLFVYSRHQYMPSARALVCALVMAFMSVPVCVGLGVAVALAGDIGKVAIVLAPGLFGVLWTAIYRLATGRLSLSFGIVAGGLLLPCFMAGTFKYVVLFAVTSSLLCAWQAFAGPRDVVAIHGVA